MIERYGPVHHPNDSPGDGTIHPIGLRQLAAYQEIAVDWPRYPDGRANRCGKCDQNLWYTYDLNGNHYVYTDEEKLALVVAHIRQNHPEVHSGID
jgi:hypothetical protein